MEKFSKYCKTGNTAHIALVGTKLDLVERNESARALDKIEIKEWIREVKEEIRWK